MFALSSILIFSKFDIGRYVLILDVVQSGLLRHHLSLLERLSIVVSIELILCALLHFKSLTSFCRNLNLN